MTTPRRRRRSMRSDQRGVALTIAILVVTTLIASGLLVSARVVKNFTETRNLYLALPAYYAGESAIERSLQVIKRGRDSGTSELCTGSSSGDPCGLDTDIVRVIEAIGNSLPGTTFTPGVTFLVDPTTTTSVEDAFDLKLSENQTVSFGLFPPGNVGLNFEGGAGSPASTVDRIKLRKVGGATTDPSTWVEVRWSGFDSASLGQVDVRENSRVQLVGPAQLASGAPSVQLLAPPGSLCSGATCAFNLVQIRALYGNLSDLSITPQNASGVTAKIANRVFVQAVGTALRGSEQASAILKVSTSWKLPASGLFAYTLFSEGDIIK